MPPSPGSSSPTPSNRATAKNAVKTTLIVLEKAVDGLQVPGLKGAAGALVELIKIVEKTKQNKDALQELVAHLRRLENAIITPLLDQQHLGISPELEARVGRLTSELSKLAADWQKLKTSRRLMLSFINYEDHALAIADMNRRIKESLDAFLLESQIVGTIVQENVHRSVRRVECHLLSQAIRDLPHANATYDSVFRRHVASCFQGTRSGLLADIKKWIFEGQHRLCVLEGMAGLGKSTIAQTIAEYAGEEGCLSATFFFCRDQSELKSSQLFFCTIAFQLAVFSEAIAVQISEALQMSPDAPNKTLPEQMKKLVMEPLQKVQLSSAQPMLIILDALDECEERGAVEILQLLARCFSQMPPFKIFITTRPEPHIVTALDRNGYLNRMVLHDIPSVIVESDIRRFLEHQLSPAEIQIALPGCEWKLSPENLEALVKAADGFFIISSTAEKFIKDAVQWDPQHQLEIVLGSTRMEDNAEFSPHATLDQLYNQILQEAIPENRATGSVFERFQRVVGSLIVLEQPLPRQSLANLLSINNSAVDGALRRLSSIIMLGNEDQCFRVYHPSFTDFITNPDRCKQENLLIEPPKHHGSMVCLCFDLMKRMLRRNICNLPIPDRYLANGDIPELEMKVNCSIPSELIYACCYWGIHLSKAPSRQGDLIGKLETFLLEHLLHWFEVLSLIGRLELAYSALASARRIATPHTGLEGLLLMLNDAQRFLMGSYEIIKQSALHIYYSALPFAPSETAFFKAYEGESKNSIQALQGRSRSWNPLLSVLTGHLGPATCVAFSPDGSRLASGSDDRTVRLWDGVTGTHVSTLEGHSKSISSIIFSPNGARLASWSEDNTIRLWEGSSGLHVATLEGHTGFIKSVIFSSNSSRLVSGSEDNTCCLWDSVTGSCIAMLYHHATILSIMFSPNDKRLVSGYRDFVLLSDGASGEEIAVLQGHLSTPCFDISTDNTSFDISPDSTIIATTRCDFTISLWSCETGAHLFVLGGHSGWIRCVVFSPDGARLASGSEDGTSKLWDVTTEQLVTSLENRRPWSMLVFSPDSKLLVVEFIGDPTTPQATSWTGPKFIPVVPDEISPTAQSWDVTVEGERERLEFISRMQNVAVERGKNDQPLATHHPSSWQEGTYTLKLYDGSTGEQIATLANEKHSIFATFSPDSMRLVSKSFGTVQVWEAATGVLVGTFQTSILEGAVLFSSDSARLALQSGDGTINILDSMTGQHIVALKGHSGVISSVSFSPDGSRLASGSKDHTVRVWDVIAETNSDTLDTHSRMVNSISLSPCEDSVASGSGDKDIRVWDAVTGACISTLVGHSQPIWAVIFSPDGRRLASRSSGKVARLWDVSSGVQIATLRGHSRKLSFTIFSPDSTRLASGSFGNTIKLWNSTTGELIASMKRRSDWGSAVTFSPDSTYLASSSQDRSIQLWNCVSGAFVAALTGHSEWVNTIEFGPDSKRIATGSEDTTIRLWSVETGQQAVVLEGHTGWVWSVAFSPDGAWLASGGSDQTVRLWDCSSGAQLALLAGHSESVSSITFASNGATLTSSSADSTVQIWEVASRARLATLEAPSSPFDMSNVFSNLRCHYNHGSLHHLNRNGSDLIACLWSEDEASVSQVPLCWLPVGLGVSELRSKGTVVVVGTNSGRVLILDAGQMQLG